MDCCNFLPYRHQYYGSQTYYDAFPYPQEYYGHAYQDYYQPYYQQQQWQCSAPLTDYVYNPKEARIRKAMREASRERAMGIAPMPSPRGGIRRGTSGSNTWNFPAEDQMMMSSHDLRMMGSPMCTSPGFSSVQNTPNSGFIPSLHYAKHMHHHSSASFVQSNALARMPPQQEIWHPYEEIRSSSTGPYIIPPPHQMHGYQQPLETFRAKPKIDVDVFPPAQEHQSVQSNCESQQIEKLPLNEPVFENKLDSIQPLEETENVETNEPYVPAFSEGNFESKEDAKPKKVKSSVSNDSFKPSKKPLPDFNEAFGSTERGRFQRPPNNKGFLDYFMQTENDLKFLDFQL